jgi:transcription initiation factor TFIIIB Brf1 subunit/transcription initiation factor TFIIB
MIDQNRLSKQKCPWCQGTNVEEDQNIVKCLDCGMGKYKSGRQKGN